MPIIKSAKKRVKVAAKARARNQRTKNQLREALKAFAKALEAGKPAEIAKTRGAADRALDMAAKKSIIHRNKAARFKSRMTSQTKKAGIKPAKTAVKKAPVKPAVAKKKKAASK